MVGEGDYLFILIAGFDGFSSSFYSHRRGYMIKFKHKKV